VSFILLLLVRQKETKFKLLDAKNQVTDSAIFNISANLIKANELDFIHLLNENYLFKWILNSLRSKSRITEIITRCSAFNLSFPHSIL